MQFFNKMQPCLEEVDSVELISSCGSSFMCLFIMFIMYLLMKSPPIRR